MLHVHICQYVGYTTNFLFIRWVKITYYIWLYYNNIGTWIALLMGTCDYTIMTILCNCNVENGHEFGKQMDSKIREKFTKGQNQGTPRIPFSSCW